MNLVELDHALRKLRLSGMADVLEARLRQAQSESHAPIDLVSALVGDELVRRQDRLIARRLKQARFRDADRSLDTFDFDFNKKMNRALIHDLATARFILQREDVLFLGPPGSGKSHLAQAIGRAAVHQGHRVLYREAHTLLEEIADATLDGHARISSRSSPRSRYSSSTTSACARFHTPQPKTCSKSSCGAMSAPPRS
jgi:DNA replication protein DnaC